MKTLFLILIMTLGNVFAGDLNQVIEECKAISYAHKRECVIDRSVKSFLKNKLQVNEQNIIEISEISSKDYTTLRAKIDNKISYAIFSIVEPILVEQMTRTKNNGTKSKFEVEFFKDNRICTVELKTKLTSNGQYELENTKITVKQKYAPVCN
ncbi:MAG: hypothetical protein CME62_10490 [Halobacteriovoraceae bacterium]|nr:hypothetical protein [Halobacteriovoraceae bacterium]|tara:strand:- start:6584 stop:7042 length:459 start_codon:yes stop_codon:yes gene_type:complete